MNETTRSERPEDFPGDAERKANKRQAREPHEELDQHPHRKQLGGREGARPSSHALEVFHENEDPCGQGRGEHDLVAGARDAALVEPLPERPVTEEEPQGHAEGGHEPEAPCGFQKAHVTVYVLFAVVMTVR